MGVVKAQYKNAQGVVKWMTWYKGIGVTNAAPADFVDPDGVHWWLEDTEEPKLPEEHMDPVKDIEEIMRKIEKKWK